MSEEKRSRSANFTLREKSILLSLVNKYRHIIENKQSDTVSWKDKQLAWEKICNEFNSMLPESIHRKKDSLKKFYENIKKNVRKEVADEKLEVKKTGGGIFDKQFDPTFERAVDLMNPKTVVGLSNNYDGDSREHEHMAYEEHGSQQRLSESLVNSTYKYGPSTSKFSCVEETPTSRKRKMVPSKPSTSMGEGTIEFVFDNSSDCTSITQVTNERDEELDVSLKVQEDWGNVKPVTHLRKPITPVLANSNRWANRRRPAVQNLSSSHLSEEYRQLAALKTEVWNIEKVNKIAERQQKEELFKLQKKNLLLDNELKELQIKKIKAELHL